MTPPSTSSHAQPLAALVVTHNRAGLLQHCLQYTLAQSFTHVLVVDNASTDGTGVLLARLCQADPRLQVLQLPSNGGGALGFEKGLRALDHQLGGCGWVLLFDDDAWPAPGCVQQFEQQCHRYQRLNLTAVAAAVVSPEGRAVEVNRPILNPFRHPCSVLRRTLPTARRLRDLYHVPLAWLDAECQGSKASIEPIHAASFVGLFLRLDALPQQERWRYPQGRLFIYSDDTSYTLNLHRRGHRLALDPALRFVHATAQRPVGQLWLLPLWKHYYIVRNSFTVNASLSGWFFLPLCLLTLFSHCLRAVLYGLCQHSLALLRVVVFGIWDGVRSDFSRSHRDVIALQGVARDGAD